MVKSHKEDWFIQGKENEGFYPIQSFCAEILDKKWLGL